MEQLALFDKDGNNINEYVLRDNVKELEDGKYYMIVLNIIENEDGEILLEHASKEKGDYYTLPGGHTLYGESDLEACIRETKEEIGLVLNKNDIKHVGIIRGGRVLLSIYYSKTNNSLDSFNIQEEEVDSLVYKSLDDIKEMDDLLANTVQYAFNLFNEYKVDGIKKFIVK